MDYCRSNGSTVYTWCNQTPNHLYRAGNAPPRTTRNFLDGCRIFREKVEQICQRIDAVGGKYFTPVLLEEFKSSRFAAILEINTLLEKELLNAEALFRKRE